MEYKIGDEIKTKYQLPMSGIMMSSYRYQVGQIVDMFDKDTDKRTASFKVVSEDGVNVTGRVTNTYGHKRVKK